VVYLIWEENFMSFEEFSYILSSDEDEWNGDEDEWNGDDENEDEEDWDEDEDEEDFDDEEDELKPLNSYLH